MNSMGECGHSLPPRCVDPHQIARFVLRALGGRAQLGCLESLRCLRCEECRVPRVPHQGQAHPRRPGLGTLGTRHLKAP